jgi:hypothetical protein
LKPPRELANRGSLARAIHSHHHDYCRRLRYNG